MISLIFAAPGNISSTIETLKVKAKYIYMADFDSEDVILEHNANEPMYPSSMTKIMTALVAFQALRDKKISPNTVVTVGKDAYKTEGTTMFLNINQNVAIKDLLRGLICISGNDAAKTLAVAIEGSEEAFAIKMNSMARKIGALNTSFTNAAGFSHENHKTTAYDLYKITHYLIRYFPREYALFKERSFCFNGITQPNKNVLLKDLAFDGVKTGFTDAGKYGMVATMVDPLTKRRLILIVNGLASEKKRAEETRRLIQWGLRQTKNIYFFNTGQPITEIAVRFGDKQKVALTTDSPVCVTLQADDHQKPSYEIIMAKKYLKGPMKKGEIAGQIIVKTTLGSKAYNLKTKEDINKASMIRSIIDWFKF